MTVTMERTHDSDYSQSAPEGTPLSVSHQSKETKRVCQSPYQEIRCGLTNDTSERIFKVKLAISGSFSFFIFRFLFSTWQ